MVSRWLTCSLVFLVVSVPALAQSTVRASLDSSARQGNRDSDSAMMAAGGRYVAFRSSATNLVAGDTNGRDDVFVRDLLTGQTERVSVSSAGQQANRGCSRPSISSDGRFVAFQSEAANLVPNDTNDASDIFVRDRMLARTTRISVDSDGLQANDACTFATLSATGRYVVFESTADNLVSGDTNGLRDVFVRDRQLGTTERVSVDSMGLDGNWESFAGSISADGLVVAFSSDATNLAPNDTNARIDVFARNLKSGSTVRVSVDSAGQQAMAGGDAPRISDDGLTVVFESTSPDLVPNDTNGRSDVFVRSLKVDATQRVSVSTSGAQGNGASQLPAISGDGTKVAFQSAASNFDPSDGNDSRDVFLYDLATGETTRLSVDSSGGSGNGGSFHPSLSTNGRFVAFESEARNLVTGDSNDDRDVFVRDRGRTPPVAPLGSTTRVSVDSMSLEGNGASNGPMTSSDGNLVAFTSAASNLVAGDTNGVSDVFVRDRLAGTTTRVSVGASGNEANGPSSDAAISPDGLFVAFSSAASNLVAGDTNGVRDVFVVDLQQGSIVRASVSSQGAEGNGDSDSPTLSAGGSAVAYRSDATNLFRTDGNGVSDIFVTVLQAGATARVSLDPNGMDPDGPSFEPVISADARFAAFASDATNLSFSLDMNGATDVFVVDLGQRFTTRVSIDTQGLDGNGPSRAPAISGGGRFIAFESLASNLVPRDGNSASDVFLNDRGFGVPIGIISTTIRVSLDSAAREGNGDSNAPSISSDGRLVAFSSVASNLVPADGNGVRDAFVHDVQTGETTRASVDSLGLGGDGDSDRPALAGSSRVITFDSVATTLVQGDVNGASDVFARDLPPSCAEGTIAPGSAAPGRDVLFVNGRTGTQVVPLGTPLVLQLATPPNGPRTSRYVVWYWSAPPTTPLVVSVGGSILGCTVNPAPFHAPAMPQATGCQRGVGIAPRACRGVTEMPAPASAPWTQMLPPPTQPMILTIQGLVEDAGAFNSTGFSVTNAVVVRFE